MSTLRAVPDRPLRAIRYLRQSTEKEETISDAIQLAACDDYISKRGYVAVGDPIWEQHTGRVWHKRRGVQDAMQWVERGDADLIVVWKWNRLSRLRKHWVLAEVAIEQLGGAIESATEPADLTTSHGRFNRNIMIDLAELQSDLIGDSWRDTHATRRRRGLPATGGRRYGYRHHRVPGEPERYEIDPDEAEVLRWAYAAYIDGAGFASIAWQLNRRGVPNVTGGEWKESSVTALLDAGFAAGLLARYGEMRNGKKHRPTPSERTWEPGAHDAIIEQEIWDRYRRERLSRGNQASRNITPAHDLAGLVRCGEPGCARPMHRKPGEWPQFVCSKWKKNGTGKCVTVTVKRVQEVLLEWLQTVAEDIEGAAERAADVRQNRLRARTDVELAAREVLEIDRQLDEATRKNILGVIPDGPYVRVRDELLADRAKATERLAIAERAAEVPEFSPAQLAGQLLDEWDTLPVARRRDLLRRLIRQVTVVPSGRKGVRNEIIIETHTRR